MTDASPGVQPTSFVMTDGSFGGQCAREVVPPAGPPKLDPEFFHELGEVEVRALESYEAAVEGVCP